jgi:hypothetical protein
MNMQVYFSHVENKSFINDKKCSHRDHRGHRDTIKEMYCFSLCALCPLWRESFCSGFDGFEY